MAAPLGGTSACLENASVNVSVMVGWPEQLPGQMLARSWVNDEAGRKHGQGALDCEVWKFLMSYRRKWAYISGPWFLWHWILIKLQLQNDIAKWLPSYFASYLYKASALQFIYAQNSISVSTPGFIIAHRREQRVDFRLQGRLYCACQQAFKSIDKLLLSIFKFVTYIDWAGRHRRPGSRVTAFQDSLQPHPFGDRTTVFSFVATSDLYARLGTYTGVDILTIFQLEHFNLM